MLPISEFTITLGTSNDYLRCAVFLHVIAIIVVLRSALPIIVIVTFLLILISMLLGIIYTKTPLPRYQKLTYHPGYWLLHEVDGCQTKYERACIGFEGGIFILLTLAGNSPKKVLAIFNDQITTAQYRVLKFIAQKEK